MGSPRNMDRAPDRGTSACPLEDAPLSGACDRLRGDPILAPFLSLILGLMLGLMLGSFWVSCWAHFGSHFEYPWELILGPHGSSFWDTFWGALGTGSGPI